MNGSKQVRRDGRGVIMNPSQKTRDSVEKIRAAIGWVDNDEFQVIKVFAVDDERGVLVIEIHRGNYFLVRITEGCEPCFFQIRKWRNPRFFLMKRNSVIQWAEAFIAGVKIEKVDSLIWCGAILMTPVRAMPPEKSQQSIKSQIGKWNTTLYGWQRIAVTGKLVQRSCAWEWFADGKIAVEKNNAGQPQPPVIFSGKYKIIVGAPGDSPLVKSVASGYYYEAA
jgi:hypothetical protein